MAAKRKETRSVAPFQIDGMSSSLFDGGMEAETETRVGQQTAEADLWKPEKQEMEQFSRRGGDSGTTGDGYACLCNLDNLVHSLKCPSRTQHPFPCSCIENLFFLP